MTHDYRRNGTTTLFAALNTLDGTVISDTMPRHRHEEWLRFLKRLHRETPKNLALHIICDNYATHKHPAVMEWLEEHKRVHIHFTPTSSSWLNMVERFFRSLDPEERMRSSGDITENRIRRGVFRSVPELEAAIQTSRTTMRHQSPSSGQSPPMTSWPRSPEQGRHWMPFVVPVS